MFKILKQFPITITIALATVMVFLVPSLAELTALDLERSLISQIGQLFSCHLLHWSFNHLAWDWLMFVLVGAICELRSRRGYQAVLILSAILIPVSVAYLVPTLGTYRGLSGIDTGIFVFAAVLLIEEAVQLRNWPSAGFYAAMLVGLLGKTLFELTYGSTMFVESANFTPVPVAHIAGAIVGVTVAVGRFLSATDSHNSSRIQHAVNS